MTGYITLTRQSGLMREMQVIANNIANVSTTGYRREGIVFSEYVHGFEEEQGSVSMAAARIGTTDPSQGNVFHTGGTFDFAIEGPGFFLVDTPEGQALTRAGSFTPNDASELVTPDGYPLLDAGGAPVFVPPDAASVRLAPDGALSADGQPLTQLGLYLPPADVALDRQAGTRFLLQDAPEAAEGGTILQGFLESSNVNAITEIARMIEVQRAYEIGASFNEREGERKRNVIQTLGR